MGLRCRMRSAVFIGFGAHKALSALQQVLMDEVMDYLTRCYLYPTPSSPSFFSVPSPPLLPAAAVL